MKKKLKEVRAAIKLLSVGDISDEDAKKLKGLMAEEATLSMQVEAAKVAAQAEEDDKKTADEAQKKIVEDAVAEAKVKWEEDAAIKARRLPGGGKLAPHQTEFADTYRFDGASPGDIAITIQLLRNLNKPVSDGAYKALALRIAEEKPVEGMLGTVYSKSALKAGLNIQNELTPDGVAAAFKATTDPMYSTLGSGGDEWVGTMYAREIWKTIRSQNVIVAKFPSVVIPDGFESETFPVESADPTWYKVAQVTAADSTMKIPTATITASQATTALKSIAVAKLGARVMYSGEMVEDSLIPFAPQLRQQLADSGGEIMEMTLIDGDTEEGASTNINDIAGTPAVEDSFLLVNGLRKLGLITTTANSVSGGALSEDDYLNTMALMGTAGLGSADIQKCAFIVDPSVYRKSLKLSVLKTRDVWEQATLKGGVLTGIWGYALYPSWNMHRADSDRLANSAGKVDVDTVANNSTGSIISVRWDQWKLAYKRRMTLEITRRAESDSWEIVALTRYGFGSRNNEDAAAISYNLTI